MQHIVLHK